ncbi:PIG-L family deacetylase [Marinilongibacter aquaticus]|uniref:PIG-L family deacetylase n=1 Tax=Marinilongibacter aquaticus TaxID=2975157 RepID=UPI0021BD41C5|nr:PIG-L family deacetylase [Marinilongibacter aquaticus]UBM59218.1 PIG-L family deacetylase [Marinilongibacter aquaticus]
MKKLSSLLLLFIFWFGAHAQYKPQGTGRILHRLEKLKVLGSALYVAAHPDDENTLLLTWLSNEQKVRTAYIALTRGDGGQNLLGTEKGEFAGLLRTNELLGARSVDGGQQFFSRANDFGYTKTTEEALATWGEDLILGDLVYRIRKFRPDVIITRFPPDQRAGHGHHSASSLLAEKAFDAAADPKAFPEQLKEVHTWQAKRLVWNFYNRGFTNTPPDDDSQFIQVDIGGYNALLGASYGEIGAKARSMHKSQGFGAALSRGHRTEVLRHTKGEAAKENLFDGIDLSWGRVQGGKEIGEMIDGIIQSFDPKMPEQSIPQLSQVLNKMKNLEQSDLVKDKIQEVQELLLECSGLYTEFVLEDYAYTPGATLKGNIELTNRRPTDITLQSVDIPALSFHEDKAYTLEPNKTVRVHIEAKLPSDFPITQPYWLWDDHPLGHYVLHDEKLKGMPMNPPAVEAQLTYALQGQKINGRYPAQYKYVEPSFGEIYRPLEIRPLVSVTPSLNSLVFHDNTAQEVFVSLKSAKDNALAKVELALPDGWRAEPASRDIVLKSKYDETVTSFKVFPSEKASEVDIQVLAEVDGRAFKRAINSIKYDHIPEITSFPKARIHALKLDLKTAGQKIGYVMGAGDEVPTALRQMGYEVQLLKESDLNQNLSQFDAILIGVRAYNVHEWLPFYHDKLMAFVQNGGNLICQYQTSNGSNKWIDRVGPYPMELSHDRVSEEDAEVRFLDSGKEVLSQPNILDKTDFEGWVQERGLYFASSWDPHYQTVFSMNDKNESKKEGSLLYTSYGKGHFVYTGLSFFRELPAGVPGAYRLLANLISMQ